MPALKRTVTIEKSDGPVRKRSRSMYRSVVPRSLGVSRSNQIFQKVPTVELKEFPVSITTGSTVSNTASINLISGIAAGTGRSNMIGQRAIFKSLELKVQLKVNPTQAGVAVSDPTAFHGSSNRLMVVYDANPLAATPAITDILVSSTTTSLHNTNGEGRFIILADKIIESGLLTYNSVNVLYQVGPLKPFHKFYLKMNLPMEGPANTVNTLSGIDRGALFFIILNDTPAANSCVTWTMDSRLRYSDV